MRYGTEYEKPFRPTVPGMVDPELLEILVCPETKQPVRPADDELVERVNRAIENGTLENRGGEAVKDSIDGGLVREDGKVLYPIRDDIPIMLIDEAIELEGLRDRNADA